MGYRRFSMAEDENEAWHENELRVFIWLLVTYSYVLKKPLTDFVRENSNSERSRMALHVRTVLRKEPLALPVSVHEHPKDAAQERKMDL
jgi:hypothetical protein